MSSENVVQISNMNTSERMGLLRDLLLKKHPNHQESIRKCPNDALMLYALHLEGVETSFKIATDLSPLRVVEDI